MESNFLKIADLKGLGLEVIMGLGRFGWDWENRDI
jgi:hypothetical protein